MSISEIEQALAAGKTVCWKNSGYLVKGKPGALLVCCTWNGCCTGLTADYAPEDFHILA